MRRNFPSIAAPWILRSPAALSAQPFGEARRGALATACPGTAIGNSAFGDGGSRIVRTAPKDMACEALP